jgi:hypothetical protein
VLQNVDEFVGVNHTSVRFIKLGHLAQHLANIYFLLILLNLLLDDIEVVSLCQILQSHLLRGFLLVSHFIQITCSSVVVRFHTGFHPGYQVI